MVSSDPTYSGFKPSDVSVTNVETDTLDLTVTNLQISPAPLLSGDNVTVSWDDSDTGNVAASGAWVDTVVVTNQTNTAIESLQLPHLATDLTIAATDSGAAGDFHAADRAGRRWTVAIHGDRQRHRNDRRAQQRGHREPEQCDVGDAYVDRRGACTADQRTVDVTIDRSALRRW